MNKKSKAGRKPIGEKAMDDRLAIRLSKVEYRALQAAAKDMGYQDNLSEFIRLVLFSAAAIVYKEKAHEANS